MMEALVTWETLIKQEMKHVPHFFNPTNRFLWPTAQKTRTRGVFFSSLLIQVLEHFISF